MQPCLPANNGAWSHLAQIQELDNADKHRLLLTAVAGTHLKNFTFQDEGGATVFPEANVPMQEDAMVIFANVPAGTVFNPPNLTNAATNPWRRAASIACGSAVFRHAPARRDSARRSA